jgi:hypothetical protein
MRRSSPPALSSAARSHLHGGERGEDVGAARPRGCPGCPRGGDVFAASVSRKGETVADYILIRASDRATADAVQQALAAHGIMVNRLSPNQAVQFGMRLSVGKAIVEISPEEFLQVVRTGPDAVDAFFDTLERFRDRAQVFVNGQPRALPTQGSL